MNEKIKVITCREILEELQSMDDEDLDCPFEIAAYIFPSHILDNVDRIKQRMKDDIAEVGEECGILCFQERHVNTTCEMTDINVRKQTGKVNCFTVTAEVSLEELPEPEELL